MVRKKQKRKMWSQLKRMLVWLGRSRYSRGFGVQSPSAYQFIRYVVNEHYPYYKYKELDAGNDRRTRKLGRLYFRLANWLQPKVILSFCDQNDSQDNEGFIPYLQAGSERAEVIEVNDSWDQWDWSQLLSAENLQGTELIRMKASGYEYPVLVRQVLPFVNEKMVVVLDGIHRDTSTLASWKCLQQDERVGVTYDLYDCGIVFFDKSRFKQHYIVNF